MPCCAAVGCSNRPGKVIKVHRFPNDPNRRKAWERNTNRLNWTSTKYSVLCQAHFDENQYEQNRLDGLRKLKPNAVPTIFSYSKKPIPIKSPHKKDIETTKAYVPPEKIRKTEHSYSKDVSQESIDVDKVFPEKEKCLQPVSIIPPDSTLNKDCEIEYLKLKVKELQGKVIKIQKDLAEERKSKRKILKAKSEQDLNIRKIFNSDQLMVLGRTSTRGSEWSMETLKKALQLRFACGATGYSLLLSQGHPLPSMRTLRRKLKVINFMKPKDSSMQDSENLSEMPIDSSIEFDADVEELLGDTTILDPEGKIIS